MFFVIDIQSTRTNPAPLAPWGWFIQCVDLLHCSFLAQEKQSCQSTEIYSQWATHVLSGHADSSHLSVPIPACSESCRLLGLQLHAGGGEDPAQNIRVLCSQQLLPDGQFLEGRSPMAPFPYSPRCLVQLMPGTWWRLSKHFFNEFAATFSRASGATAMTVYYLNKFAYYFAFWV